MPVRHSRHITLTETTTTWIDGQIAKGRYASTGDLIRTLRIQDEGMVTVPPAAAMRTPLTEGQA
ncbi:type II toxin-antitoxin system ParD family antitoxin [Methylobacterium flocculans]|uniref:type II toxin-antitoxin system ParD family antitoxin n=1 Tax=Methylobacterium flocculans TaxID=2984843 RepID=UPI0021F31215|nr:type II toxin-antitoxin system ParD family antitoxin [Methylobacterium sp. FF17]